MSTAVPEVGVNPTVGDDGHEPLNHLVCCNPDLSLCGLEMCGEFLSEEAPTTCVVCADLAKAPCQDEGCDLDE